MTLIRLSITILALTIFKASAAGVNLPIFYSVDNDWKVPEDPFGYNHDRLKAGYWNDNTDTKPYKIFPSAVSNFNYIKVLLTLIFKVSFILLLIIMIFLLQESPLDVIKWRLPRPQQRDYNGRMQRVARLNGIKRDDLKVAMDGLRRYFGRI